MDVYAYTADLAQPDEKNPADIPPIAHRRTAPKAARLVDCREALVREGIIAIQCGAFHLSTGGQEVLQHHAARPRGDRRPRSSARCARTTCTSSATAARTRATTSSASIATASSSTRSCSIYKPWLDQAFVEAFGGRKEMSEYLAVASACRTRWAPRRRTRTDANVLGATHEAKDLEHLDKGMHIVEPIMGVAHWKPDVQIAAEAVTVEFERGVPVAINGKRFGSLFELVPRGATRSAAATASA